MTEQDDMEKIRTAHIEQSRMAGHPERLPNNLRKSERKKNTSIGSASAIYKQNISHSSQKSSVNKKKKYKKKQTTASAAKNRRIL